jgi:2-deoxy-D-gluconate 3-dehydrogenase
LTASLFDLSGRVALVTGARRGIGRAIAEALAGAGADIIGLGPNPMPETEAVVAAAGRRFVSVIRDLGERHDYQAMVSDVVGDAGRIDILVNNAGIIRRADLLDTTEEDWDAVLAVNLRSVFLLSQAVARHMVEAGISGRIINIASVLAFQGGIRVPAYTAAKHAVAGMTRAMANELGPRGITVNAIAPGYIATDNTAALRADQARSRQLLERIPLGRFGRPDEIATAALFLAAPGSSYVTGSIVSVDGGWLSR